MIKLFENYNEIAEICEKYDIKNWTLNGDGSIDVAGSVEFYNKKLTRLPLKFGRVMGSFYCTDNNLTTLEGAPNWVERHFYCNHNNLTTLQGAPNWVGGGFYCRNNKLTTLWGAPREVGGTFDCSDNNLTSLVGSPRKVGSYSASFFCNNNRLTTLDGAPIKISGNFSFDGNKLPIYFNRFIELNKKSKNLIMKEILKWQDEYELWKNPEMFEEKFKRMMVDIQENDLPHIKMRFPRK